MDFTTVAIGNRLFEVEIARSMYELQKGLGSRTSIPRGSGMLFIYNTAWYYEFWMKDMNFPIDIIGFDRNGKVVEIMKDLKPQKHLPPFMLRKHKFTRLIQAALEVNAGDSIGVRVGDYMDIAEGDMDESA